MWTRERVISTYRRESEKAGKPLGVKAFNKLVPERAWRGRHFARFSELVEASGYASRTKNNRLDDEPLLCRMVELARSLGHFPTEDERTIARRDDETFPSNNTLRDHFGGTETLKRALGKFCESSDEHDDVLNMLGRELSAEYKARGTVGFVYMMKYGKHYKIGFTSDVGKRGYDLKLLVPEPHRTIHYFETDDPRGIEAYWHRRFADKLCDGTREYFALSPEDVAAFRRRKRFM